MSFAQRLAGAAAATEGRLDALLQGLEQGESADASPARLVQAMRHALLGGGKRFRPFLTMESAALFGVGTAQAAPAAAAIECVHCYSLAHDDLPAMDNDEVRRGRPTVWKAFDEWTAILAGDALLTLAFEVLASPETHADGDVRLKLITGLARAAGADGMVGGQALDLDADKRGQPARPDGSHVRRLQAMKTGALIRFSAEAGAMLGRASDNEQSALSAYGAAVGAAFQIADDLLDAEGDAATVGKRVAKDAAAGKATLVSLIGIEAARASLAEAERTAIDALAPFGPRADTLREAARFVVNRRG